MNFQMNMPSDLSFSLAIFTVLCYIFAKGSPASADGIVVYGAAQGASRFCKRRTEDGRRKAAS
jgi:hypothetical protein